MAMAMKRSASLVGGGPAPGTNGAIAATALEADEWGDPIGFHDGFDGSPSATPTNSTR